MKCATGQDPEQLARDGKISMADLDEIRRFRVFLKNPAGHCPECLELLTDEHGPGDHPETFAVAKAKWPDLTDEQLRSRCREGWAAYCQGRVSLAAVPGMRR